jgi:hypothetical protein
MVTTIGAGFLYILPKWQKYFDCGLNHTQE